MSVQDTKKKSRTDWKKLEAMTDDEIDVSDIPPLAEDFFKRARLYLPSKQDNVVELDPDISDWFKAHSRDQQAQINQVLREYIQGHEG